MRLIDADALNIRDISPSYWSHVLGVEKEEIDDAPTVNAIPVEWIQEKIDVLERDIGSDLPASVTLAQLHELISLKRLITDWWKERLIKDVERKKE